MALAWTSADYSRSTLNPNAPPFIPSSFQRAASSPPRRLQSHRLLNPSRWAEDYRWIDHRHHHGQALTSSVSSVNDGHGKTDCGPEEEEDIAALLPETFEVEDFSLGLQEEAASFHPDAGQHKRVDAFLLQDKIPRLDIMAAESLRTREGGRGVMSWSAVEVPSQYWQEAASRSQWHHLQPYSASTFLDFGMLASTNQ